MHLYSHFDEAEIGNFRYHAGMISYNIDLIGPWKRSVLKLKNNI